LPEPTLTVRAHPRAASESIGPWSDGVLHVRVTRPPADGEANAAIRRAVAEALDVAPSRLRLVSGERGRTKRFAVHGLAPAELAARLAAIGPGD
jgi:hypothetical protein